MTNKVVHVKVFFMFKTVTYFILVWNLFCQNSFAQEIGQGHYFLTTGVGNQKQHSEPFNYGLGFRYLKNESLEVLALGLKHKFKNQNQTSSISYGLENADTQRLGIKYPFYIRLGNLLETTKFHYEIFVTQRYFPEFYKGSPLNLSGFGGVFKYINSEKNHYFFGSEYAYNFNGIGHRDLVNFFTATELLFNKKFKTRLEYSKNFKHHSYPHVADWLLLINFGVIY